ncbi:MAG: septum formation initiator family protein [Oscillospiraceae bacterium]|nr:septum formation initiator family protein [Oscillospiraceae bacterium]
MERNQNERRRDQKEKRRSIFDWIITRIVVAAVFIVCIVSIIVTQANLVDKRAELADLNAKIEAAEAERIELEKFVETDDLEGYMEKAAIEKYNYAYPNERRFFDTSRN